MVARLRWIAIFVAVIGAAVAVAQPQLPPGLQPPVIMSGIGNVFGAITTGAITSGAISAVSYTGGQVTVTGSSQGFSAPANGFFGWTSMTFLTSPSNALMNINNNAGTLASYQMNVGTAVPSVTTCGTGAIALHSNNMAGSFTTTGATTCTLTFGAPAWTFTPFCVFTEKTTAGSYRISAESTTAITITGFTSGDAFTYGCGGGGI